MNIHDGKPDLRQLVAALALGLGAAGCQDKPPEMIAGVPGNDAQEKMAPESDIVKRAATSDAALAARVKDALGADPALKAITVDVAASGNAVTLLGTADTTANRDKASLIALSVQGVNSVENRMVIIRGS